MKVKDFKSFINEGVTDVLTPKSEDQISDAWQQIAKEKNPFQRAVFVKRHNLPDKYLPTKDDYRKYLKKSSNPIRELAINFNPDKYKPTNEEYLEYFKKMDLIDRIRYIKDNNGFRRFFPTSDEIIDYLSKIGKFKSRLYDVYRYIKIFKENRKISTDDIVNIFKNLPPSNKMYLYNQFNSPWSSTSIRDMISEIMNRLLNEDQELISYLGDDLVEKLKRGEWPEEKKYPRGYLTFKMLDYVEKNPGCTRSDIAKLFHDLKHGHTPFKYDPSMNRGYFRTFLTNTQYLKDFDEDITRGWIRKRGTRVTLSESGEKKLEELRKKFDYRPSYAPRKISRE